MDSHTIYEYFIASKIKSKSCVIKAQGRSLKTLVKELLRDSESRAEFIEPLLCGVVPIEACWGDICNRTDWLSKQMVRPWPPARVCIVILCIVINEDQRIRGHIMVGVALRNNISQAKFVGLLGGGEVRELAGLTKPAASRPANRQL